MKIFVASTCLPLRRRGMDVQAAGLVAALTAAGHEVEPLRIPFHPAPADVLEQLLALRLIELSGVGDLLIAVGTPAYLVRHQRKVVWLGQHWCSSPPSTARCDDFPEEQTSLLQDALTAADNLALGEARRIFAGSQRACEGIRRSRGLTADLLRPPLQEAAYRSSAAEPFVLLASRVATQKRQRLAIESMRHVQARVRLVLVGEADEPEQVAELESLARGIGLSDRVEIRGPVAAAERIDLLARATATLCLSIDDDSGYVALESFASGRPVIACSDSGATAELVRHEVDGLVVKPTPVAVAAAIDRLAEQGAVVERMGAAVRRRCSELTSPWATVAETVTA